MQRLIDDYRRSWSSTGPAGRRLLLGGFVYLVRAIGFTVAFPLFAKANGSSARELGVLLAASSFALFLFGVPVTWLGGRGYSRQFLVLGPIVSAVGVLSVALLPADSGWPLRFAALLTGAAGTTFWVLSDPLLARTTPAAERAHIFALKFALLTLGVALGGGLGGWIPALLGATPWFDRLGSLRAALVVLAALDLLAAAFFSRIPAYESRDPLAPVGSHAPRVSASASAPSAASTSIAWMVMLALAVPDLGMSFGHNGIRPLLSLFFTERFGLSEASTGSLLAVLAFTGGFGALAAPWMASRLGNLRAIALLRSLGAAMVVFWFLGPGLLAVIPAMFVYYQVMDGTEAIMIAEAMRRLPAARRTWFSGITAMAWSLSSSVASFVSGTVQDRHGGAFALAFVIAASGYVFSVLWITLVVRALPSLDGVGDVVPVFDGVAA